MTLSDLTQARGISTQNRPLTRGTTALAHGVNVALATLALSVWIGLRAAAPEFGAAEFLGLSLLALVFTLGSQAAFGTTVGHLVCGVRRSEQGRFEFDRWPTSILVRAIVLTLAPPVVASLLYATRLMNDPRRQVFDPWVLQATLPDLTQGDWSIQAYYFATGAWPRRFDHQPILYTIPYERGGPPRSFIGRILAHWVPAQVVFTAEGPKTPMQISDMNFTRECFAAAPLSQSRDCITLRRGILQRHIAEMNTLLPEGGQWTTRQFEVRVPNVDARDWTRGLFVQLRSPERTHSRFILFTNRGQQQSFLLTAPTGPLGDQAFTQFQLGLTTQRVTETLAPGRAWSEQKLGEWTPPASAPAGQARPHLDRFAELQLALVSRLSVDPARVDWYYHFARSARVLSEFLARSNASDLSSQENAALQRVLVGIPADMIAYARDLGAADPDNRMIQAKITEIEQFVIESKKLAK